MRVEERDVQLPDMIGIIGINSLSDQQRACCNQNGVVDKKQAIVLMMVMTLLRMMVNSMVC